LLLGIFFIRRSALPRRDFVIAAGTCRTPVTLLEPPSGIGAVGSAILLHGLAANRRTMMYLGADFAGHGFRAYLLDLPGHGDSRAAFTFANAQQCADLTVESLIQNGQLDPRKTILLGHSMGGAIAIRMADVAPLAATIAISPAPMATPRRMPSNLLVFSAQFDLGVLKQQARSLAAAAQGDRSSPQDFAEQRAFHLQIVPYATHTSPLLDRNAARQSEQWAMLALFPTVPPATIASNLDLAPYDTLTRGRLRLAGSLFGLLGLAFFFPACATLAGSAAGPPISEISATKPLARLVIAEQAVCGLVSVLLFALVIPLKFLRLYDGDYLASLLLVSGLLLLLLNWQYAKRHLASHPSQLLAASALGFAVFLAVGAWLNLQLSDLWLNAPRWLRFAALLPVAWIFCFAEEIALGPVASRKQRAWRFATFLGMRLELWLACVLAYFMLGSGQALLGILFPGLAAFSILQRLATDTLRLRTGSATAAAAFGAILAAWFIAAVFPLS